ncbi:MAG: hypothetical protein V4480_04690 [Patescibacteria group bacterium]
MSVIIPAILPTSRADLDEKLLQLQGLCTDVQIDIVDGRYVRPASWPYSEHPATAHEKPELEDDAFSYLGRLCLEMDLMVERPEIEIARWIRAGASRITVHAETAHNLPRLIRDFKTTYGHDKDFAGLLSFGLAIHIGTDISLIEPYLDHINYVQFMGISSIGKQGEPFDRRVLPKIAAWRRTYPDMPIQVDGGVSLSTAPDLLSAGVSRLIVGSALWRAPNMPEAFKEFTDLTVRYGMYA